MGEINRVWVRICALDDVPAERALGISVSGQQLILVRCNHETHVYQGFCSHMLYSLAGSRIEGCTMTCGLHHSQFDVRDGSVVQWAAYPPLDSQVLDEIRKRKALRTYETRVIDGDVYISWAADRPEDVRIRVDMKMR